MSSPTKDLFPAPSPAPSNLAPVSFPGKSPQSTAALRKILEENHKKWHVFFNEQRFHNHAAHRALAIWALGADDAVLHAGFEADSSIQKPAFASPGAITDENFNDHLGDEKYYNAYMAFFKGKLEQHGIAATIERYVFSQEVNFNPKKKLAEKDQPRMLDRFMAGLHHPMIHTGYGLEFGLPVMVIEGLAQAAVHPPTALPLIPASLFTSNTTPLLDRMVDQLKSSLTTEDQPTTKVSPPGSHAFSILARILKDPRFGDGDGKFDGDLYVQTMRNHGHELKKYIDEWVVDPSDPKSIERKIEELAWMNVIIYGVGGWPNSKAPFNADFHTMHMVTSSLFLSSIVAYLTPPSQVLFLQTYFGICVTRWVARGRPAFDFKGFFEADIAHPTPPGPLPTPAKETLPSPSSSSAVTPNPWLPIIQTSIVHPDDHLPKLQRALQHYAALYGTRTAGLPDFAETELPFADKLDGTLFIRVAGLSAQRMGRVRDGEEVNEFWDRHGYFDSGKAAE